jgi:hypothetical protein
LFISDEQQIRLGAVVLSLLTIVTSYYLKVGADNGERRKMVPWLILEVNTVYCSNIGRILLECWLNFVLLFLFVLNL